MRRPWAGSAARPLLALALGAAALAAWWTLLGGPDVLRLLSQADAPTALLGFFLLVVSQLVRWLRWHVLVRAVGGVPFGRTFRLLYAAELFNVLLPVKLGDAGRAVALSRIAPFTLGSATATIVVDRLSGVLARLAVAPLVVVLPLAEGGSLAASAAVSGVLLAAAAGAAWIVRRRPGLLPALARKVLPVLPARLREPAARTLSSFAESAVSLGLEPVTAARTLLLSFLALAFQAGAFWLWFRAAGADLVPLAALVGTAYLDLLAVLPAPPAGLGVAEWSVTFVFAFALGAPAVATSAVALLSHGLWLLLVLGLGAVSASALAEMWPRRAESGAS